MSSFNAYSSFYLPREIKNKLVQFQYQNDFRASAVETFKDLKDQILSGPVTIRIMSSGRFKVEISLAPFNEAICHRHYFGVRRIHRLCRSAERLASTKWATAWTLTTCYYASFFAAVELLHVTGKHVSYFSPDEIDELNTRALPSNNTLSAGTYLGVATFNSQTSEVEIIYNHSETKPHVFAWHQLRELVQHTTTERADAVRHRETLLRVLGAGPHGWCRPSEIRNRWNYSDATLFCERGETLGASMSARILQPRDAHRWGEARHFSQSEENEATGLAYLRAALVEAVDNVAQAILPEDLALEEPITEVSTT
ncbi:MAG: hypothetical protein QM715_08045 [Nibricoccus sp.]